MMIKLFTDINVGDLKKSSVFIKQGFLAVEITFFVITKKQPYIDSWVFCNKDLTLSEYICIELQP